MESSCGFVGAVGLQPDAVAWIFQEAGIERQLGLRTVQRQISPSGERRTRSWAGAAKTFIAPINLRCETSKESKRWLQS